jgi:hypothetical protein
MNNRKLANTLKLFSLSLIYLTALHVAYVREISPVFTYLGFVYERPAAKVLVLSWAIACLPVLIMPNALKRPSQVVVWVLYLLVYVPSCIIPFYTEIAPAFQLFQLNLVLLAALVCLILSGFVPLAKFNRVQLSPRVFNASLLLFSVVSYGYILATFGLRFSIPDIANVYDVRLEYRDEVSNGGPFLAYFILWQGNVINNFIMARGFAQRKYALAFLGFVGQVIIFSITGYKSMFFSSIMVAGIGLALRGGGKKFGGRALTGGVILVIIAVALDELTQSIVYTSLFVRRVIISPGLLTGYYFDFFSHNEKAMMAHSVFSPFLDYPYDITYNFIIGYFYSGRVEVSMNANFLADGFANFGFIGILVFAAVLAFLLWLVDSLADGRNFQVTAMVLGIVGFSLSNSALLTVLVSHGFGLLIALLFVMPAETPPHEVRALEKRIESRTSMPSFQEVKSPGNKPATPRLVKG